MIIDKDAKLITEAYFKVIREANEQQSPAPTQEQPANNNNVATTAGKITPEEFQKARTGDYTNYINWLKTNAVKPEVQALLLKGDGNTDIIKFEGNKTIPVKSCRPTQNEIDAGKSLNFPLKDPTSFLNYAPPKGQNVIVNNSPILVYTQDGNTYYIIDGHHRWSQVYAINPEATINCIVLIPNKTITPIDMLKAVQTAIAAINKDIPNADVDKDSINFLTADDTSISNYVLKKLQQPVLDAAIKIKYATDANTFAQKIVQNSNMMRKTSQPIPGAPKRDVMPQTDQTNFTELETKTSSGKIDTIYNPEQPAS